MCRIQCWTISYYWSCNVCGGIGMPTHIWTRDGLHEPFFKVSVLYYVILRTKQALYSVSRTHFIFLKRRLGTDSICMCLAPLWRPRTEQLNTARSIACKDLVTVQWPDLYPSSIHWSTGLWRGCEWCAQWLFERRIPGFWVKGDQCCLHWCY